MSRFYANIQGSRGEATRQGTAESGIRGHIRGWRIGARVLCHVGPDGEDHVTVFLTGGSSGPFPERLLGKFTENDLQDPSQTEMGQDDHFDKKPNAKGTEGIER